MSAGLFATARRGGLTIEEVREIEAHRNRDRPTPWQALAARYGRSIDDIKVVITAPRPESEPAPVPSPRTHQSAPDSLTRHERRFRQLWEDGMGVHQIAEHLCIGLSSVSTLRARLNLPSRRAGNPGLEWTPAQDDVIRREHIVGGKSAAKVAAMLGCSRNALLGRVHRLGWSKHLPTERLAA